MLGKGEKRVNADQKMRWRRYRSPRILFAKIQEKGLLWCLGAAADVARIGLRGAMSEFSDRLQGAAESVLYRGRRQLDVLYAFYDLQVSPATFDIVVFLVLAELARREEGLRYLHVVIVPGTNEGFRPDAFTPYDTASKSWRLRNVLVPCCWLIPSCMNVTVCVSRREAKSLRASLAKWVFPEGYAVGSPKPYYSWIHVADAVQNKGAQIPSIEPSPTAQGYVRDWIRCRCGGRKVVTITLRECAYEQERNSNLKDWAAFACSLDKTVYCPVIIRDIDAVFEPVSSEMEGMLLFPEAVWNIELRAALCQLSYLNLSVASGPFVLSMMNQNARGLLFKILVPSCGATSEKHLRAIGMEPGSQPLGLTSLQRWVWEDDRLEAIQAAFKEMCDQIEARPA